MTIDLSNDMGYNWGLGRVMTEPPYATLELLKTVCVVLNITKSGGSVYPELQNQLRLGLLNSLSELDLLSDIQNSEKITEIEDSIMTEREGVGWKRYYRRE